jgi:two-component system, LytTR family, sensor kinase
MSKNYSTLYSVIPSKAFWLCNLLGWLCFIYITSFTSKFHGSSFNTVAIESLPLASVGILTLWAFRYVYIKMKWNLLHPITMIPAITITSFLCSVTIAVFSYTHLTLDGFYDLYNHLFVSFDSENWLEKLVGDFINYLYLMQAMLMVFVFVKAEREKELINQVSIKNLLFAITILLLTDQFIKFICFVAYINKPEYLFSSIYFFIGFSTVFLGMLLSCYMLLIKPRFQLARSRLLPLMPMILAMVFFTSAFGLWLAEVVSYIYMILSNSNAQKEFDYAVDKILNGVPAWGNESSFVGTLRTKCSEQFIFTMLLLYFTFSNTWAMGEGVRAPYKFDLKAWMKYWFYNIAGWSIAGIFLYISDLLDIAKVSDSLLKVFVFYFVMVGAVLTSILRVFVQKIRIDDVPISIVSLKMFFLSCFFAILQAFSLMTITYLYLYNLGDEALFKKINTVIDGRYYFYKTIVWFCVYFFLWSLIYVISIYQQNKISDSLRLLRLEKSIKDAQLNVLSGKIDPHFIFNALNNIRSLIREDADKARDAINILSDLLRGPIAKIHKEKTLLVDEIHLVRNYIALSKIQLESRLDYREHFIEGLDLVLIPPMMLQILVENAIKHGISQLPEGGVLSIEITMNENKLICVVTNTGKLHMSAESSGFGVGINNIKERISLLYNDDAEFSLREDHNTVVARIIIPLEYSL